MTSEKVEVVPQIQPIKVGSQSDPNKIAEVITRMVRELGRTEAQAIGAGALNQAIKAVAIARGYLAPDGIDLVCYPAFVEVDIDGGERTAIRLFIERRDLQQPAATTKPPAIHQRRATPPGVFPLPIPIQAARTRS